MFDKIFIEKDIQNDEITQNILKYAKSKETVLIDSYDSIWGKVKKPYLQKRTNLNLFIARKKGQLIKETPPAYGHGSEKHFYHIHSYNCIYECEYCYLQGYFETPDLVIFVNHDEIIKEMESIVAKHPTCWFHAGEFSDSLALSHMTNELSIYFKFFKKFSDSKLELRTKSTNIKILLKESPLKNVITTFSLSPSSVTKELDKKTPSLNHKLRAINELHKSGFPIGIHLDPIVYSENFQKDYETLLDKLAEAIPLDLVNYFSLGVVRFTKDVYKEVKRNYPDSVIHKQELIKGHDQKVKYPRPLRIWILNQVKKMALQRRAIKESIYLCMENE